MSYFDYFDFHNYRESSPFKQRFKDDKKKKEEEKIDERGFFFPNACQTCGCMGSTRHLLRCSNCQMISYCSKEHQTEDYPFHRTFCKAVTEIRKTNKILEAAKNRSQEFWVNAKLGLSNLISTQLHRKLTLREQKILQFPRACLFCHETNQHELVNCPQCPSVSFCKKHKEPGEKSHAEKCPEFKLCHIIELEKLKAKNNLEKKKSESDLEEKIEYLDPNITISVIKEVPIKSLPDFENSDSMRCFRDILSPSNVNYNLSVMERVEIADSLTKPMSVFQALKRIYQTQERELIIHVIAAKLEDLDMYLFWEPLLHWMPKLSSLKVVLVSQEFGRQNLSPKLCKKCVEKQKQLVFELHNLYENFMQEKSFSKPNLIVGFQVQVKNEIESLRSISNIAAPFAFTSDSEKVAQQEHRNMKKILGKFVQYETFEENPFSGRKPTLNFETDGISYEHQFLTVYTDLGKMAKASGKQNGV